MRYLASPAAVHLLADVGGYCVAVLANDSAVDTGPLHVEFFVCAAEDDLADAGLLLYGGRLLVPNVPPRTTMVLP